METTTTNQPEKNLVTMETEQRLVEINYWLSASQKKAHHPYPPTKKTQCGFMTYFNRTRHDKFNKNKVKIKSCTQLFQKMLHESTLTALQRKACNFLFRTCECTQVQGWTKAVKPRWEQRCPIFECLCPANMGNVFNPLGFSLDTHQLH